MSCTNRRCDGHGWVNVLPSYADQRAPVPPPAEEWEKLTDDERAEWQAIHDSAWEALAQSVYPCKECRPDAFYLWAQGHYASDHDRGECEICTPAPVRRSKKEPTPASSTWNERRDLD